MSKIVIDGEKSVLGRLASFAAKKVLQGDEVVVLNAEKVFVIGNRWMILDKYMTMVKRGRSGKFRGPIYLTSPERILKRTIRGMLRYKEGRGRESFKKVKCYEGVPEDYSKSEKISVFRIEGDKKGMTLKELSNLLRGGQK